VNHMVHYSGYLGDLSRGSPYDLKPHAVAQQLRLRPDDVRPSLRAFFRWRATRVSPATFVAIRSLRRMTREGR
jgi:hypothetical protein